jgi:hypothetical protein
LANIRSRSTGRFRDGIEQQALQSALPNFADHELTQKLAFLRRRAKKEPSNEPDPSLIGASPPVGGNSGQRLIHIN